MRFALRILCFHDRTAFLRFNAWFLHGVDRSRQDALFFTRPWSTMTLCTAESPHRVVDLAAVARMYFACAPIEHGLGTLPRLWLQEGIVRAVRSRGNREDLVRLNRRMVAAVQGGTAWSEDLFRAAESLRKLQYRRRRPTGVPAAASSSATRRGRSLNTSAANRRQTNVRPPSSRS